MKCEVMLDMPLVDEKIRGVEDACSISITHCLYFFSHFHDDGMFRIMMIWCLFLKKG